MNKQDTQMKKSAQSRYSLEGELCKHAWYPHMTTKAAEQALEGAVPFTYILRKGQKNLRKYDIAYVDANGRVCHDSFTLVNPKLGIFLNGQFSHLGRLEKVVRDMMHCEKHQGQPLTQ